ncbi:N-acetylmuramoyl-L-alanine amidase [Actinomadura viridis]|uniref:peptidoglycan recognition protein family protein n=1 Tax=Actinomadura viridis TaxID=58110 RepID=UPI00368E9289
MSMHQNGGLTRRGLAALLGLGLVEVITPGAASADGRRIPREGGPPLLIHTRRDWQALPARRPATVFRTPPNRIVVHHTATPNSEDYSLTHAYRLSRRIQRFHMRARGWDDTGQQLTISRGGHIMEGRNRSLAAIRNGRHVVGAQALNHNGHTIGIENEGDYGDAPVPGTLWDSLVETCAWLCAEYDLDPFRAIVGHRDLVATDCPGDVLYGRLTELREDVSDRLDAREDQEDQEDQEEPSEDVPPSGEAPPSGEVPSPGEAPPPDGGVPSGQVPPSGQVTAPGEVPPIEPGLPPVRDPAHVSPDVGVPASPSPNAPRLDG